MKNVPLGTMRRVKHHVLPQIDPTIPRRSLRVAICTSDLALRDLSNNREPTKGATHVGNVLTFVSQVVKLKDNRVRLAAIYARVKGEVLPYPLLILRKGHGGCRLDASEVTLPISQIPEALVLDETFLAPGVTNRELGIAETEFVE
jgi:hypothetical protein